MESKGSPVDPDDVSKKYNTYSTVEMEEQLTNVGSPIQDLKTQQYSSLKEEQGSDVEFVKQKTMKVSRKDTIFGPKSGVVNSEDDPFKRHTSLFN